MEFRDGDVVSLKATVKGRSINGSMTYVQIETRGVGLLGVDSRTLTLVKRAELKEPPVCTVLSSGSLSCVRLNAGWVAWLNGTPYNEGVPQDFETMQHVLAPLFRRAVKAYWANDAVDREYRAEYWANDAVDRAGPELKEPPVGILLEQGEHVYVRLDAGWVAWFQGEPYNNGKPCSFEDLQKMMKMYLDISLPAAVKAYWLKQAYSG